eukprot:gene33765-40854_t
MRSLMLYGFALKDNPYDGVEIYVSLNPSSTEHYSLKLALLDKLALSSHRSLYNNSDSNNNEGDGDAGKKSPWRRFVLAAGDKERSLLPKELMVFLRVQQLDKKTLLTSSKKLLEALAELLEQSLLAYPPLQTNTNTSSISEEGAFVHPMHRQIHAGFLLAAERLILAAAASLCAAQLAQLAGEKKKMTP